jgi:polyisoprenoid-binding protein YceI
MMRSGAMRLLAALVLTTPLALLSAAVSRADTEPSVPSTERATADAGAEAGAEAAADAGSAASTEGAEGRIGFVGRNIFGRAPGTFSEWRVVGAVVDLANPVASDVRIEVALASVDTGNADRDEHLRTADFFDVEKHPVASVRGHSARPLDASPEGHSRYAVRFDVDLHGVRKSIDGEIELVDTDPVVVEGGFLIRRTDFGIGSPPSRWNPMSIDDEVPVRFRVEFD